jgi:hypothetical protein
VVAALSYLRILRCILIVQPPSASNPGRSVPVLSMLSSNPLPIIPLARSPCDSSHWRPRPPSIFEEIRIPRNIPPPR